MKNREEAARFIEKQLHYTHKKPKVDGRGPWHYGLQDLRELMDFIYESEPTEKERIVRRPTGWNPD